jgi:hypothetical protein
MFGRYAEDEQAVLIFSQQNHPYFPAFLIGIIQPNTCTKPPLAILAS